MRPVARAALPALLALALAAGGCGRSSGPTQPGPAGPGTIADYQALLQASYVAGAVIPTTVVLSADVLVTMQVAGVPAAAAAFQAGGGFVDAGRVSVADQRPIAWGGFADTLVRRSVPVNGVPFYAYSTVPALPATPSLVFDGVRTHWFEISGSAAVPAFRDSVLSVNPPIVSVPASGATVPRTAALAIQWTDGGVDTTVYVLAVLRSLTDTTQAAPATLVRDGDDATSIPAQALRNLPAGAARLAVGRYRLLHHSRGGHPVDVICEAVTVLPLTLQ